ncbi:MAG: hypothetical protein D6679_13970 [Candidatus Hydrogenedentota bacterium]|nr:MAG: hypothetical protein D6679_13970 [Candidatus Hydrogenedentota bacterium]
MSDGLEQDSAGIAPLPAGLLFVGAVLFYLATLRYDYPYDGVAWAILLEHRYAIGGFHAENAHYIPFYFLTQGVYFLLRAFFSVRAVPVLQIFCASSAAFALVLLDRFLAKSGFVRRARIVALLALGTAPHFWRYASTMEVYPLGFVFLIGAAVLRLREEAGATLGGMTLPPLGHQSLATFSIACLADSRRHLRDLVILVLAGLLFIAIAFVSWTVSRNAIPNFRAWLFGHAAGGIPPLGSAAAGRAAGRFAALVVEPAKELSVLPVAGNLLFLLGLTGLFVPPQPPLRKTLLTFLVLESVFCLIWHPFGNQSWVFLLFPVAVGLAGWARKRRGVGYLLIAVLLANAAWGYVSVGRRAERLEANPYLVRALEIGRVTEPNAAILIAPYGEFHRDKVYVPYFSTRFPFYIERFLAHDSAPTPLQRWRDFDREVQRMAAERPVYAVRELRGDTVVFEGFGKNFGIPETVLRQWAARRLGEPVGRFLFRVREDSREIPDEAMERGDSSPRR